MQQVAITWLDEYYARVKILSKLLQFFNLGFDMTTFQKVNSISANNNCNDTYTFCFRHKDTYT